VKKDVGGFEVSVENVFFDKCFESVENLFEN
jgi:hypothetical protein